MNSLQAKDLNLIAQAIYDKKGFNILVLDVRNVSTMTDFFIIAEGTVDRHVKAIGQSIRDQLELKGQTPFLVEGEQEGDWMVLDYTDFVIHLFTPELREKYRLEELWHQGKVVDVQIETTKPELTSSTRTSHL